MDPIITEIRNELNTRKNPALCQSTYRFFKEDVLCYGFKTRDVSLIAKKYWDEIKSRKKSEIFALCEILYQSGFLEESFIVSDWMSRYSSSFAPDDIMVFKNWINMYITNWASCDGFCNHAVGDFIEKFPDAITEIKSWALSENRWMRRASAVSLIIPAKHGKFLKDVFAIADILLLDQDDMVRKGYGWLLKEASRKHQDEVFSYVMAHKKEMPRTSLRYAIELMPPDLRKMAMVKDW